VYKVCWGKNLDGNCAEADILAAFDDALHDGVNIISASFGSDPPLTPFFSSSADIGSFHAMQLGVSSVFSAGNAGPDPSLVGNVAPWTISVAASSIDRVFPTEIVIDSNFSVMVIISYHFFLHYEQGAHKIILHGRRKKQKEMQKLFLLWGDLNY
jgi:hypothetical protein